MPVSFAQTQHEAGGAGGVRLVKYLTDQNIKFYGLSLPLATHADACSLFVGGGVRSKRLTEMFLEKMTRKALQLVYAV